MKLDWQKHPKITPREYSLWLVALFIFSILYNKYIDWLIYVKGEERGKTARLVIWGVLVTSIPATRFLTPWEWLRCFFLFCASGSWVTYGHWRREQWDQQLNENTKLALERERRAKRV